MTVCYLCVYNVQKSISTRHSYQDKSIVVVLRISKCKLSLIEECRNSFFKCDAVLLLVGGCFVFIPLKIAVGYCCHVRLCTGSAKTSSA